MQKFELDQKVLYNGKAAVVYDYNKEYDIYWVETDEDMYRVEASELSEINSCKVMEQSNSMNMTNKELRKEIESISKYDGLGKITLSCEIESTSENTYYATCYVSVYNDNNEYVTSFSFDEIEKEDLACTDNDVIETYKKFEKTKKAYLKKHFDCLIESIGCFNI